MMRGKPIEVFFCTAPQSEERAALAEQMLLKWRELEKQRQIKLIVFQPQQKYHRSFQKIRRVMADQQAVGNIYILTDDDMESPRIEGRLMFMPFAAKVMEIYSQPESNFGMLSAWPDPARIAKWTPEDYLPFEDENVQEVSDVGGLRICRKGLITEWPEQNGKGYDREHCEELRRLGYRVGYLKNVRTVHHGEGKSDLFPVLTTMMQ